jgi:hypothetical protein
MIKKKKSIRKGKGQVGKGRYYEEMEMEMTTREGGGRKKEDKSNKSHQSLSDGSSQFGER